MCWNLETYVDSIIAGMYFDWNVSTASNSTNSIDAWKQWLFLFHRKWNCSKFSYCFNEKGEKQLENQPTKEKKLRRNYIFRLMGSQIGVNGFIVNFYIQFHTKFEWNKFVLYWWILLAWNYDLFIHFYVHRLLWCWEHRWLSMSYP